jgi:hypothetical protein
MIGLFVVHDTVLVTHGSVLANVVVIGTLDELDEDAEVVEEAGQLLNV